MTRIVNRTRTDKWDVSIGRDSVWGNPYTHNPFSDVEKKYRCSDREEAIAKYREWIQTQPALMSRLGELRGKTLACWCKPLPCHGDVLVELVEQGAAPPEQLGLF